MYCIWTRIAVRKKQQFPNLIKNDADMHIHTDILSLIWSTGASCVHKWHSLFHVFWRRGVAGVCGCGRECADFLKCGRLSRWHEPQGLTLLPGQNTVGTPPLHSLPSPAPSDQSSSAIHLHQKHNAFSQTPHEPRKYWQECLRLHMHTSPETQKAVF